MMLPLIFILVGAELLKRYVYVFKDDPDKGYDGNEEGAKGQGAYVVEDTAETSKDRSCWVTFFEVPERG